MFHVEQYYLFCMWVGTIIITEPQSPSPSSFSDPLQYRASVRSVSDNTVWIARLTEGKGYVNER